MAESANSIRELTIIWSDRTQIDEHEDNYGSGSECDDPTDPVPACPLPSNVTMTYGFNPITQELILQNSIETKVVDFSAYPNLNSEVARDFLDHEFPAIHDPMISDNISDLGMPVDTMINSVLWTLIENKPALSKMDHSTFSYGIHECNLKLTDDRVIVFPNTGMGYLSFDLTWEIMNSE